MKLLIALVALVSVSLGEWIIYDTGPQQEVETDDQLGVWFTGTGDADLIDVQFYSRLLPYENITVWVCESNGGTPGATLWWETFEAPAATTDYWLLSEYASDWDTTSVPADFWVRIIFWTASSSYPRLYRDAMPSSSNHSFYYDGTWHEYTYGDLIIRAEVSYDVPLLRSTWGEIKGEF